MTRRSLMLLPTEITRLTQRVLQEIPAGGAEEWGDRDSENVSRRTCRWALRTSSEKIRLLDWCECGAQPGQNVPSTLFAMFDVVSASVPAKLG